MELLKHLRAILRKTLEDGKASIFVDWKSQYREIASLPKTICRFIVISFEIPISVFTKIEKTILKCIMKHK